MLIGAGIGGAATQIGKGDPTLSRDACDLLRPHLRPGNIRGLQNATERYNIDAVPD